MDPREKIDLRREYEYISDLENIIERLLFDQQVDMPPTAGGERSRQVGILQEIIDRRILGLSGEGVATDLEAASQRVIAKRAVVSGDVQRRFVESSSVAFNAWKAARESENWAGYAEPLQRMVDVNRAYADTVGYQDHPMDALLSAHAPGPTQKDMLALFDQVESDLISISRDQTSRPVGYQEHCDGAALLQIMARIGDFMGFDRSRGTLGFTPHGGVSPAGPNDVRVTVRKDVPIFQAVSTAVHEFGHALYSQGVGPDLHGTLFQDGSMPYLQESQSKFWENIVGRRPIFIAKVGKILHEVLGKFPASTWTRLYAEYLLNTPVSNVRVATSEASFNLHIMLRHHIESDLLIGELRVADVPGRWNELCFAYFGAAPNRIIEGALQDPHWSRRYFGLFTGYIVGNLAAAQFGSAMAAQGIDIDAAVAGDDMSEILSWLRRNVHRHGSRLSLAEVLQETTGAELCADYYLRLLAQRYT